MNGSEVLAVLNEIAATSSRTGKEVILARHKNDPLFRKVLKAALDPFTTYGIAKMPQPAVTGRCDIANQPGFFMFLEELAARKITGHTAAVALSNWQHNLDSANNELMRRIILRDLRCGITVKTVNKVIPGFIVTFECMLAHPFEEKRIKVWPQVVEPKLDGVRTLAFVGRKDRFVKFFSRSGREYTTFDHLVHPIIVTADNACMDGQGMFSHDFVLDGEIVSGSFNKTVSEVRRKEEQATDAIFHIFDILPMSLFSDESDEVGKYLLRRAHLEIFLRYTPDNAPLVATPRYFVNSVSEIMEIYQKVRDRGLEGLIVKDPNHIYVRKRSHGWMKIKAQETIDVEVVDAFEGTGKYEGKLGGLIVDVDGVRVRVGGGFTDEQRVEFWETYLDDLRRQEEADFYSRPNPEKHIIGRLIEVEYHEKTPDGSLRHPRFVRFRDDKPQEEAA